MTRILILSATLALACAALAALPAHAVGRLADVSVIDRDSGQPLPVYRHDGQWWVAGRPGARYAIEVRNATGARLMGVMAVDGVNILNGETAGWDQVGYVFGPRQTAQITGWRKSDEQVAAFHFTALPRSYAARTGRPDHVGVIGVALFRERLALRPHPPALRQQEPAEERAEERADAAARQRSLAAERSADASAEAATAETAAPDGLRAERAPEPAPRLGTGHGEREASQVANTRFTRRTSRPDELITLRYDSRENLIALGVIPTASAAPRPLPFPDSPARGYVPDPPGGR